MDKVQERVLLNSVFGFISDIVVIEGERPDFRCCVRNHFEFGVEVTEFFLNEGVARLRRINGYGEELLSNQTYRHRLDRQLIPVREVIYKRAATGEECKILAIRSEEYTISKVAERILNLVRDKNEKFGGYNKSVQAIDLIIHDVEGIAGQYEPADLIRVMEHIGAKEFVVSSPFREIIVVTRRESTAESCIPLRATIFASEVFAFQSLFREFYGKSSSQLTVRDYLLALAAYLAGQFKDVDYATGVQDSPEFYFASVAVGYSKEQSLEIRDVSGEVPTGRTRLSSESDLPVLDSELQKFVNDNRVNMLYCVPICFRTFSTCVP